MTTAPLHDDQLNTVSSNQVLFGRYHKLPA